MAELIPWHQLFGLSLADFFRGTDVRVELEKDLSLKQQLLDVVILRPEGAVLPRRLPDGFEPLAAHNLVSFKSHQDTLDGEALDELVGHFMNYRKQVSPSMRDLLPLDQFRRFAVTVRFPRELARQAALVAVMPGVYEARHFTGVIRIVVACELPREEHNAMLHLFTANEELTVYGAEHYRPYSEETSTLLLNLIARYRGEGLSMAITLEELVKRTRREVALEELPALLPQLSPEQLAGLTIEQRLAGLTPEDLVTRLTPEQRAALLKLLQNPPPDKAGGSPNN
jgi:hypothetical protein